VGYFERCIGCKLQTLIGYPDENHISTSFVEGHNLFVWYMDEPPIYSVDQCLLEKMNRESRRGCCPWLLRIQLPQDSSYTAR
jgi:hypothetical protein